MSPTPKDAVLFMSFMACSIVAHIVYTAVTKSAYAEFAGSVAWAMGVLSALPVHLFLLDRHKP